MSIAYTDGDFTVAKVGGPPLQTQPFRGDNGEYLLSEDWMQTYSSFAALALNTPHAAPYASYYLVQETPTQPTDAGIMKWQRIYAQIPADRSDYEAYAARLPGLGPGGTVFGANPTVDVVSVTTPSLGVSEITTATPHNLVVGNPFTIFYDNTNFGITERPYNLARFVSSITGAPLTSTVFRCYFLNVDLSLLPHWLYIQKSSFGRAPFTQVVNSRLDFKYYLPSVSGGITTPDDIPILTPQVIADQFGFQTDTYTTLTTPSQSSYQAQINAGTWIVAEGSTLRRWQGNIYERTTRYIRAQ